VIDSHVHTELSGHAIGRAPDYARAAAAAGVDVITFTEHMPIPGGWDPNGEYTLATDAVPVYLADVADAQQTPGVKVLCGAEIDWLPEHPGVMERNSRLADFDMILGSVHFIDDWAFDDPNLTDRYATTDVDELWRAYFGLLEDAAASGLFDVMAHPDLIKKFAFMPSFDPTPLYESAAQVFSASGVAIEVSTAGLRRPCKDLYPSARFLEACATSRVPATISSDAHKPEDVAWGYETARRALLDAGYESVVYFVGRRPVEVSIAS
jgi:histidinol-phosphatase (PHP family)